jgi:hypothetical protein
MHWLMAADQPRFCARPLASIEQGIQNMKNMLVVFFVLLLPSALLANSQTAIFDFDRYSGQVGETVNIPVRYSVLPAGTSLAGIGIQIHYDSTVLAFEGVSNFIRPPYGLADQSDIDSNDDGSIQTDRFINVLLVGLDKDFLPDPDDVLFQVSFEILPGLSPNSGSTIHTTSSATAVGFDFIRDSTLVQIQRVADFDFANRINVPPATEQVSDPLIIQAVAMPASNLEAQVINGEVSVNGGPFQSGVTQIDTGDQVRVRHLSANGSLETVTTTLIVDGIMGSFSTTTAQSDTIFGDRFEQAEPRNNNDSDE